MWDDLFDHAFWMRIFLSLLCGFIIGLERQMRGKPVGIRTSMMICIGTMLFIYLGEGVTEIKDSARVLGQVVTGIGFLGAGVILTRQGLVSGVTSASVVWLLAGIGSAIGFERFGVALVITLMAVLVLGGVQILEDFFLHLRNGGHKNEERGRPDRNGG